MPTFTSYPYIHVVLLLSCRGTHSLLALESRGNGRMPTNLGQCMHTNKKKTKTQKQTCASTIQSSGSPYMSTPSTSPHIDPALLLLFCSSIGGESTYSWPYRSDGWVSTNLGQLMYTIIMNLCFNYTMKQIHLNAQLNNPPPNLSPHIYLAFHLLFCSSIGRESMYFGHIRVMAWCSQTWVCWYTLL